MVWIHGGSFNAGSGDTWWLGPNLLVNEGVIVVTFNYRLGILGFLNSGDGEIQGNFGLKDQVMALRWVKENIAAFGGDPNEVTIFGESAGSVSVSIA
jgi:bile salt-stimulated lipase